MIASPAISLFEDQLRKNAVALGLVVTRANSGIQLTGDIRKAQEFLAKLLEATDDERIEVITDVRPSGVLIGAFELVELENARTYSLVTAGAVELNKVTNGLVDVPASKSLLKLMAVRYNEPAFFTVLGPEGVGKTTLCEGLERIFRGYPMPFLQFHHTGAWKSNKRNCKPESGIDSIDSQRRLEIGESRSAPYRLIRGCWRMLVPGAVKRQLVPVPGEFRYMKNVLSLLVRAHYSGQIVVADRYCYDRLTRWRNLKKPIFQRVSSYLTCVLMRKPFHAFVLRDEPERIYARKQTMPVWEIKLHQLHLKNVCASFTDRYEIVDLSKYDGAGGVRIEVSRKILQKLGTRIFDLIKLSNDNKAV